MAKLSNGKLLYPYQKKIQKTFSVSATFGPTPAYNDEALDKIVKIMNQEIPLNGKNRCSRTGFPTSPLPGIIGRP